MQSPLHFVFGSSYHRFQPIVEVHLGSMNYPTIERFVGFTPLVRLQRLVPGGSNTVLVKLEGNNPAGSVRIARR